MFLHPSTFAEHTVASHFKICLLVLDYWGFCFIFPLIANGNGIIPQSTLENRPENSLIVSGRATIDKQ